MQYAGFWIRVGAYLIDWIILIVVISVLQGVTGINMGANYSASMGDLAAAGGTTASSGQSP